MARPDLPQEIGEETLAVDIPYRRDSGRPSDEVGVGDVADDDDDDDDVDDVDVVVVVVVGGGGGGVVVAAVGVVVVVGVC